MTHRLQDAGYLTANIKTIGERAVGTGKLDLNFVNEGPIYQNGLDGASVIALDNVVTIPAALLGRTVGYLSGEQEILLARAIVLAYDLDVALLDS